MSSLKSLIASSVARILTSIRLQNFRRSRLAMYRKLLGRPATVLYFHQADDPYSVLLASQLGRLQSAYRIKLECFAVPPPEASAAPDLARLVSWSERDAKRLSQRLFNGTNPSAQAAFIPQANAENLELGVARRKKLGHYLGAMLYFEGEWYWGLDRLHHLEKRLREAGLSANTQPTSLPTDIYPVPKLRFDSVRHVDPIADPVRDSKADTARPVIHFFCSLRSPYTYLAAQQIRKLAEHYGADLQLRFVLPMVMRGLPVPWIKRLYILRDTKREAIRLGMAFGNVVDPVGKPVEDGLALLHYAITRDRGPQMLEAFLAGVFAQGIDAASVEGLKRIARQADLSDRDMQAALADQSWRAVAERNRNEMLAGGIWGVPSFRVNDGLVYWGQDRLWMLEEDLISAIKLAVPGRQI